MKTNLYQLKKFMKVLTNDRLTLGHQSDISMYRSLSGLSKCPVVLGMGQTSPMMDRSMSDVRRIF